MSKKFLIIAVLIAFLLMSCGSQGSQNEINVSDPNSSTSVTLADTSNTRPSDTPVTMTRSVIVRADQLIDQYCTNEKNDDPDDDWPNFGCGVIVELRWQRGPQPGNVKSGFWLATVMRKGGVISTVTNIWDENISSEVYFAKFPLGSVIKWDRDGDNDTAAFDEIQMMYAGNGAL